MAKLSIVFTSFNHREFLVQALDSIVGQSFDDFELIIIDDCSTDGSQEILKLYAEKDNRIRLFLNEKNSGSYVHSTNLGASKATAPYLLFAQCDDYAEPTQLEKLYSAMVANPSVGVVYSSSIMVDHNGTKLGEDFDCREKKFKSRCFTDTLIKRDLMSRYFLYSCVIPNLSAALIKRELFEKQGGLSSKYFVLADWDFWLKTTLESDFFYIREPLNNFRQHNTTIRASVKLKRQVEEVFRMYYDYFKLAQIGFFKSLRWRFHMDKIWSDYFFVGKLAWIKSVWSLYVTAIKYDSLQFFITPALFTVRVIVLIGKKIIGILLKNRT